MKLRDITLDECQQVRVWRNDPAVMPMLRTGYKSEAEQEIFYWAWCHFPFWRRIWWWLLGRERLHRYYALEHNHEFIGIAGLTYINSGEAEISLILGPDYRRKGLGPQAIDVVLAEAWRLGMSAVIGECYRRGALKFWAREVARRKEKTFCHYDSNGTLHWRWVRP